MSAAPLWQFFIDRGGTFTDCIGRDPQSGALAVVKVPSSDEAPLVGIRQLLGLSAAQPIPPCEVRLGTTLGTNALLERRGARSALLLTRGFGDLLELGDQTRPELFALRIEPRRPLPERVLEIGARLAADGQRLEVPDAAELERAASGLREAGVKHVASGFEVAPSIGYLKRASSVAIDAYVTPLLQSYLARLADALPGSR